MEREIEQVNKTIISLNLNLKAAIEEEKMNDPAQVLARTKKQLAAWKNEHPVLTALSEWGLFQSSFLKDKEAEAKKAADQIRREKQAKAKQIQIQNQKEEDEKMKLKDLPREPGKIVRKAPLEPVEKGTDEVIQERVWAEYFKQKAAIENENQREITDAEELEIWIKLKSGLDTKLEEEEKKGEKQGKDSLYCVIGGILCRDQIDKLVGFARQKISEDKKRLAEELRKTTDSVQKKQIEIQQQQLKEFQSMVEKATKGEPAVTKSGNGFSMK